MKRAIITGATGAIGMALIDELISQGIEVLVFCREDSLRKSQFQPHKLLTVKYASLKDLKTFQNDTGKIYDVFYHFAWEGTFGQSRNDMYLQNRNVEYALDAVALANRFGCKTFIGAGSQAEYGRAEGLLDSRTPTFPENGYGIAKLCAGQMTRLLAQQLGLSHIWVRVLSIFGPFDGKNSMVMSTISKLQNNETAEFTKGEQLWDYLYSGDAATAYRLVGECGKDGKTYVLGSGKSKPLAEYIMKIKDVVCPQGIINLGAIPYLKNQVMYLCADISELQSDTGWSPIMTFEEGIKMIIKNNS